MQNEFQPLVEDAASRCKAFFEEGVFSEGKAFDIAHALYYDNPKRIFKL